MTQATATAPQVQTTDYGPQDRISLWKGIQEEGKPVRPVNGKITISPELLQKCIDAGMNSNGEYELQCALFTVQSTHEKAPFRAGPIEMPYRSEPAPDEF